VKVNLTNENRQSRLVKMCLYPYIQASYFVFIKTTPDKEDTLFNQS